MAKKPRRPVNSEVATSQDPVVHVTKAPCSVDFSRDAKGQARWAIKVYGEESEMDDVVDRILGLDQRLREGSRG